MKLDIKYQEKFEDRHNGLNSDEIRTMLKSIGIDSLDKLIDETIPSSIRLKKELNLPNAKSEKDFLECFSKLATKNKVFKSYIGMGYYDTITPKVILRNILENPGWYTSYTPYQAEIAQGRMEALVNFQTVIIDLTGMEIANASLLDEGTAAAESMTMLFGLRKGDKKKSIKFFVDKTAFPQSIEVIRTRAEPLGIEVVIGDVHNDLDLTDSELFGLYIQNPNDLGEVTDYSDLIAFAKQQRVFVTMGVDLLSLLLLKSPGEMGADVVVGSSQRFGISMGYGGPHAAFFATKKIFKRQIPGRIIGISVDVYGNPVYRMALQTREQHIRREKATSNICTSQALLAVIASMYAVYHGPDGLKKIAARVHGLTQVLFDSLSTNNFVQCLNKNFFDTIVIKVESVEKIRKNAQYNHINFRYYDRQHIGISLDETTTLEDIKQIYRLITEQEMPIIEENDICLQWEEGLIRKSEYLKHPIFNSYQTEHELLRYMKKLENKDLSLVHSMISLGSCTMKLNATTEMIPITWENFARIHPFAPIDQVMGYSEIFENLNKWLCEITGFDKISFQPNSGAQGEYTGLMVIRAYHHHNDLYDRNVTLIPNSAHGTNPASAVMAGMKVILVKCDKEGNIDLQDLKSKADTYKSQLAALMITYPSTHGVFEENIKEICSYVHECGGLVYMDGANMNAQVGLTSPANIGADVCHLNLHKTFCIPHGGGGPGMGPIGVAKHLTKFLPRNPFFDNSNECAISCISSAPFGSASILTISYAYIAMMGASGLKKATQLAILNANYIKHRLTPYYNTLYLGLNGRVAHEMIIDCREFKKVGIEVEDIAKRLIDYSFHAPTVSFPVSGTMMIEPTESESLEELNRFCDALIQIRKEIKEVEENYSDVQNNVLKNAPHTASSVTEMEWNFPYSRKKAIFPLPYLKEKKFWPSVGRIDNAYGDRNLMCSCLPIEQYEEELVEKV